MMFTYPAFLWALLAVIIPIIIHLFNFRRYKKVYFTNVRFLKELQHESKSKSRLKEILILIARCFAITCLVLAFCQPIIIDKNTVLNPGANAVSIYIDNSFSMDNVQKQGPLLDIAKLNAKDIVKAFSGTDKFQIITNDFEGKHQRFYSKEDVTGKIDEVKISSSVKYFSDVLKRQYEFLNSSNLVNKKVYALSDAQKSTFDIAGIKNDTSVKTTIIPLLANQVNNVYIDSCWFESPLQQKGFIQKLHAYVVNMGANPINAGSAKLFVNKAQLGMASFSIEPMSKKEILFSFECKKSGFNYGSIKIEDYPVTFDDELFFAFNSKINIPVTLINGKNLKESKAFEDLFKRDSLFNLFSFNEQAVDYSKFKASDVIVLNQLSEISSGLLSELTKFNNRGGSIMIVPAEKADINSYNFFLSSFQLPTFTDVDTVTVKADKIETENKFYTGVFEKIDERLNLPVINNHYKILKNTKSNFEILFSLQNGDPLMGSVNSGTGLLYLFTSAFDPNKHAIYVPIIYRICFSSLKSPALFYEVNSNTVLSLKNEVSSGDVPPHIKEINNKADIIPEIRGIDNSLLLYTRSQINMPGFYEVVRNNEPLLPLAFNHSRKESDLNCYSTEEVKKLIGEKGLKKFKVIENYQEDISKQISEEAQGKKLWKLFIILALSFIIIEILLLRFLK